MHSISVESESLAEIFLLLSLHQYLKRSTLTGMSEQEQTNWGGREYTVEFTDIFPTGRAGGEANGRVALSLGALPGEQARVCIAKHKKGQLIADVVSIEKESDDRVQSKEDHYLHCSPWQIASYESQLRYKQELIGKSFKDFPLDIPSVEPSSPEWGYRTRIEYGVKKISGLWSLVLHGHNSSIAAPAGCLLASETMNRAAFSTLKMLQEMNVEVEDIKSIVVRESKTKAELVVAIYIFPHTFPEVSRLPEGATSLLIVQADPDKLISVPKKVIQSIGATTISENIAGLDISYPFDAFFQNNMPLYEKVLKDISDALPSVNHIVDIYAGVGVIGLSLHDQAKTITAYEVGSSMVKAAQENAVRNNIASYEAYKISDTTIQESNISDADVVIVNPTRRGLSEAVVSALSTVQPKYVVYLSCNHQTQARDISKLNGNYRPVLFKAYDFYPHTPHVESLIVLKNQ